jgi:hypothetical protein
MCKYTRNIDFTGMLFLLLLEITTFVFYFLIMTYTFDLDESIENEKEAYLANLLNCILSMSLAVLSLWMILIFGLHSLYFKIIPRLIWYIIW